MYISIVAICATLLLVPARAEVVAHWHTVRLAHKYLIDLPEDSLRIPVNSDECCLGDIVLS